MTPRASARLSLVLAVVGALLITTAILERATRKAFDETLPQFNRSRPELSDWPRKAPQGPRV